MEILDLGLKMLSGGITGYMTNNLALKMLFKKYGPFGGMILKTRQEFTKNISALVEKDIINQQVILEGLATTRMQSVLQQIVTEILQKFLLENVKYQTIDQIPGFVRSSTNFQEFANHWLARGLESLLDSLLPQMFLTDVLPKEHLELFFRNIRELLTQLIKETEILEDFLESFWGENATQRLEEFFSPLLLKIIEDNLISLTADLQIKIEKNFDYQLDQFLDSTYDDLEISNLLKNLETSLKAKSLAEIFGQENLQKINAQFVKILVDFFQTAAGQGLLKRFIHDGMSFLKQIEISVIDLFTPEVRYSLEKRLQENLPRQLKRVLFWVKKNQAEIEALLEEALRDTLDEESTKFFAGKVKKSLYEIFFKKKTTNLWRVIKKMLTEMKDETNLQVVSTEISIEIMRFLKTYPIGQMITSLEAKNIVQTSELVEFFNSKLAKFLNSSGISFVEQFSDTKLNDLLQIDLTKYFEDHLRQLLFTKLKDKFLYGEQSLEIIQNILLKKFRRVSNLRLSELTTKENLASNLAVLKKEVFKKATKKEASCGFFVNSLFNSIKDKKLSVLIEQKFLKASIAKICQGNLFDLESRAQKLKNAQIANYISQLQNQESLTIEITELILGWLTENSSHLLQGQISRVVQQKLALVSDQDFQTMIEEFMGRELKPITYFGGVLGICAAVLLFFTQGLLGDNQLLKLPLSSLTYGFVGYLTNVIALKMIFKPYESKKIGGFKLPFTPGVVAKEKPRFASAMGRFVGENLLNQETVKEILTNNRQLIKNRLLQAISVNDFQLVEEYLRKDANQQLIFERIVTYLISLDEKARRKIMQSSLRKLAELNLKSFDLSFLEPTLKDLGYQALDVAIEPATNQLVRVFESELKIGVLLPELLRKKISVMLKKSLMSKISKLDELQISDKLTELTQKNIPDFQQLLDKPLKELLAAKELNQKLVNYLLTKMRSDQFSQQLEDKIVAEVDPDTKIEDLFAGKLLISLETSAEALVEKVIEMLLQFIGRQRGPIIEQILKTFRKEASLAFTLGKLVDIEGTVVRMIDCLIDHKIPFFLKAKRREFTDFWVKFLKKIGQKQISELGIDFHQLAFGKLATNFLNGKLVEKTMVSLVSGVLESVSSFSIKSFVEVTQLTEVNQIFSAEADLMKSELASQLFRKKDLLGQRFFHLIEQLMDEQILQIPLMEVVSGVTKVEIFDSLKKCEQMVFQSKSFNHSFSLLVSNFLQKVENQRVDSLVAIDQLVPDLLKALDRVLQEEVIRGQLKEKLSFLVSLALNNLNQILDRETKDYLANVLIDSTLDALENNFLELIDSINIQEVTEKQIRAMEPEKIERLFESFAGKYFRKLESYGWIGSILGLGELVRLL